MYDIGIIGLGPAGATIARMLGHRYRVLAVDRKDLSPDAPGAGEEDLPPKGKCCGGLLAPDAQKSLAKFGLTLPRDILVDPQIFAVRTIDLHLRRERYYQRFYLNLDRRRFDCWLRSLIPESVRVMDRSSVSGIRRVRDGYAFRVTEREGTGGRRVTEQTARILIGADGGGSLVRRAFYPEYPIRRYVALQEWYLQDEGDEPYYASIFDPDVTDCYAWTIRKDRYLVVGAALPEADAARRFELLKRRLQIRGYRFGRRVRREGCIVHRPTGPSSFVTGRDGVYLVGEAAGFISPSSLEGISYGLDSGYLLAKELAAICRPEYSPGRRELLLAGERYGTATLPIRAKLLGKWMKTPFMYHPLLRGAVMESGLTSIPGSLGTR